MSSGFISEAEIAEQRKTRQEEWERVRKPDEPAEAPEDTFDPRSLFERLQEQKNRRDAEYEEAHKLKNMIKGLDDDEVEFLDLVDRTKLEEERKKNLEEQKEMRDFKAAVASLQEKSLDERLKQELKMPQNSGKNPSSGSTRNSQLKLLAGVVIKKPEKPKFGNEQKGTKRKLSSSKDDENQIEAKSPSIDCAKTSENIAKELEHVDSNACISTVPQSAMKCIGILPGLGSYEDSSDSDCSSDTDQDPEPTPTKYDLLGRKIEPPKELEKR